MTDLTDLIAAIKTRWDAASLATSLPGGLHSVYVPPNDMPYAVIGVISSVGRAWTNGGTRGRTRFDDEQVQFSIYNNTGMAATSALAKAVIEAFDGQTLTLSGSSDRAFVMRFRSQNYIPDDAWPNGLEWAVTFGLTTSRDTEA